MPSPWQFVFEGLARDLYFQKKKITINFIFFPRYGKIIDSMLGDPLRELICMQKRNILLYKNIYVSDKDTYILTFPGHIYIFK